MKQQVFNPYLPSWEYIPDGEPYVFGDRVYVYGSHDSFGAPIFCVKDYVCWSAPVTFTFSFIICRLPLPFLLLPPTLHYDSKTVLHAACYVSEYPDF
jgi:hypothetical protein